MNLYLVRHTRVNVPAGICYGETDVDVRDSFQEDAGEVISKLDGIHFTHCFSSPLTRCRILANTIIKNSLIIRYDDRLKELNFGQWEGKQWSELCQTPQGRLWYNDYINTVCPGGESYADLLERIRSFLDDLKKLPGNSEVLIVSHGGPIRSILVCLENIDPTKIFDVSINHGGVIDVSFT